MENYSIPTQSNLFWHGNKPFLARKILYDHVFDLILQNMGVPLPQITLFSTSRLSRLNDYWYGFLTSFP